LGGAVKGFKDGMKEGAVPEATAAVTQQKKDEANTIDVETKIKS
jgi:sec-independent protein translocase protein TatA